MNKESSTPFWQRRYGDLSRGQRRALTAASWVGAALIWMVILAAVVLVPWKLWLVLAAGLALATPLWLIGLPYRQVIPAGLSAAFMVALGLYQGALASLFG